MTEEQLRAALDDLSQRLSDKAHQLDRMADDPPQRRETQLRLHGKASGVMLARSFVDEIRRGLGDTPKAPQ